MPTALVEFVPAFDNKIIEVKKKNFKICFFSLEIKVFVLRHAAAVNWSFYLNICQLHTSVTNRSGVSLDNTRDKTST